jgi:hypothetical protein
MSLDKDISQRLQEKYDPGMADEAREWIEMCLGETLPNEDLMDTLKDGTVLCRLLNVVKPGSTKYKASKMPFVQVHSLVARLMVDGEHLQFPRRCQGLTSEDIILMQKLGVPPFELFQTVDLYEKKNTRNSHTFDLI